MPRIVLFDESASPQRVTFVTGPSENPEPYFGRTDAVIGADLTGLVQLDIDTYEIISYNVPLAHWKHAAGQIVAFTQAEIDAKAAADAAEAVADAAAMILDNRVEAKNLLAGAVVPGVLIRALADIVKDEINLIRQWLVALKAEVAAASSFGNLKTRVATLPDMPDRTLVQLRTSIEQRIDNGSVDS